jgi:hypothetical protein
MTKKRAKNLSDGDIKKIVEILDGWSKKLTWKLYIAAIQIRMRREYTRQALYRHERIRHAFEEKQIALDIADSTDGVETLPVKKPAIERQRAMTSTIERLEKENSHLLEQFARWAYNAYSRGLTREFLDSPLPAVNRGQTHRPQK